MKPNETNRNVNQVFDKQYAKVKLAYELWFKNFRGELFEDGFQEFCYGYIQALSEADLDKNYHAYCLNKAKWQTFTYLRTVKRHSRLVKEEAMYLDSNDGSGLNKPIEPNLLIDLERQFLTQSSKKQSILISELFINSQKEKYDDLCVPEFSKRWKDKITKKFRENIMEIATGE